MTNCLPMHSLTGLYTSMVFIYHRSVAETIFRDVSEMLSSAWWPKHLLLSIPAQDLAYMNIPLVALQNVTYHVIEAT